MNEIYAKISSFLGLINTRRGRKITLKRYSYKRIAGKSREDVLDIAKLQKNTLRSLSEAINLTRSNSYMSFLFFHFEIDCLLNFDNCLQV